MNRPVPPAATTPGQLRLEAFVTSDEARDAVLRIQHHLGCPATAAPHEGTLATAARMVGMADMGELLVAELGAAEDPQGASAAIAALAAEGCATILLGHRDDIATYRACLAAGATDYLVLPLEGPLELRTGQPTAPVAAAPAPRARTIGVCGVSGGVGASMLAANLCLALQDQARDGRTPATGGTGPGTGAALLDADLVFGSQAVDFDVAPSKGLLDALLAPSRVDRTFLDTTMVTVGQGLQLYSAELADMAELARHQAGMAGLVTRLRQEFATLVIDLPRAQLAADPGLADELDELILVLGPGFGSVRAFTRLIDRLGGGATGPRIWPVLSQTRRDAGLRKSEIAETLDRAIALDLPLCGAELARAQIKGLPLLQAAPRSAYGRAVRALARHVAAPAETKEKVTARGGRAGRGRRAR